MPRILGHLLGHLAVAAWFVGLFVALTPVRAAHGQGLSTPKLITHDRLDSILTYVHLSDAQLAQAKRLHDEYLINWSESFDREIGDLNAAFAAAYTSPRTFVGESMAKQYMKAKDLSDRLRFRLKGANDTFLDQVEFLLADSQLPGMWRARMSWERFCLKRSRTGIPEKHIDVVNLIEQMQLTPQERAAIEEYLIANEAAYVAMLLDVLEADGRRAVIDFQILDVGRASGEATPSDAAMEEMSRLRAIAGKLNINAWKQLVETNRRMLNQMAELLGEQATKDVRRQYLELAYPQVHPDPANADALFEKALLIASLDPAQREVLNAFRQMYVTEHASLSDAMCKAIYRAEGHAFTGHATNQIDAAAEREKLIRLGLEREELNLAQPVAIRAMLREEQLSELPVWRYESVAPPRPWDPMRQAPPAAMPARGAKR